MAMMRLPSIAVLLLVFVAGSGCASSRIPDERPQSLSEVNQQLEGRWARILRTEDEQIKHLENVEVGPDSTTFYYQMKEKQGAVSTRSVREIQVRGRTGAGQGFISGAAPGIATMFLGGVVAVTNSTEGGPGGSGAAILGLAMVGGGLLVGLIGGTAGALIGDTASEDQWVTVYEGPVENYQK